MESPKHFCKKILFNNPGSYDASDLVQIFSPLKEEDQGLNNSAHHVLAAMVPEDLFPEFPVVISMKKTAANDAGSNAIRMVVGNLNNAGGIDSIENIRIPVL